MPSETDSLRQRKRFPLSLSLSICIALLGSAFAGWGWAVHAQAESEHLSLSAELENAQSQLDKERKQRSDQRMREAQRAASERLDADMARIGLNPGWDGVYWAWMAPDEYTCGYSFDCIGVVVVAMQACSSIYVEAAILAGETHVGMTNELTSAVEAMSTAAFLLEDHTGNGDGFRITKISCR